MAARVVLASASPRRRSLLRELGIEAHVEPADVPEVPRPGEAPRDFARRVAGDKVVAVAPRHPGTLVVAADTIVVADECILGKPVGAEDARRMLRLLSGRTHEVVTAVALVLPDGRREGFLATTEVSFRVLADDEIEAYVATGEPADKAGAYAIQGGAAPFVTGLRGSYSNVVGLPLEDLRAHLERCGVGLPAGGLPP